MILPLLFEYSSAENWAEEMFEQRRHDFGTVAIGAEAVYRFKFTNKYSEDVHVASVRSSCGCTDVEVTKTWLKTDETSEVVARLNTSGQFEKDRSATITVVFDKPYFQEAQLQATSYIRPDVVINPGAVEFGNVTQGKSVTKHLKMLYAGRNDWELLKIERNNLSIEVEAEPVERSNGRVTYDIAVTLAEDTPPGYLQDMVRFVTNDPNPEASSLLLPVHAYVASPLMARPVPFLIGNIQPGKSITKNIIVRGDVPFRVVKVSSKDPRFRFASSEEENSMHVIPVTFVADARTGEIETNIMIQTNMTNQAPLNVWAEGNIIRADGTEKNVKERVFQHLKAAPSQPQTVEPQTVETKEEEQLSVFAEKETETLTETKKAETEEKPFPQERDRRRPFPASPLLDRKVNQEKTLLNPHAELPMISQQALPFPQEKQEKQEPSPFREKVASEFLPDGLDEEIRDGLSTEPPPSNAPAVISKAPVSPEQSVVVEELFPMTPVSPEDAGNQPEAPQLVVTQDLFQEVHPNAKTDSKETASSESARKLKFVMPKISQDAVEQKPEKVALKEEPAVRSPHAAGHLPSLRSIPSADNIPIPADAPDPLSMGREALQVPVEKRMPETTLVPPVPGMVYSQRKTSPAFDSIGPFSAAVPELTIPKLEDSERDKENDTESPSEIRHEESTVPSVKTPVTVPVLERRERKPLAVPSEKPVSPKRPESELKPLNSYPVAVLEPLEPVLPIEKPSQRNAGLSLGGRLGGNLSALEPGQASSGFDPELTFSSAPSTGRTGMTGIAATDETGKSRSQSAVTGRSGVSLRNRGISEKNDGEESSLLSRMRASAKPGTAAGTDTVRRLSSEPQEVSRIAETPRTSGLIMPGAIPSGNSPRGGSVTAPPPPRLR
jgi:hypothetical protein